MDAEEVGDFLDRFDIDIDDEDTLADLIEKIEARWQHKYDMTDIQKSAIERDWQAAADIQEQINTSRDDYYRTSAGNYFPRLATKGIRRVTFKVAGVSRTRYVIPGRQGLFSLGSARKAFRSL